MPAETPDSLDINFTGEAYAALRHLSCRTGKSIEEVVARAIDVQKWCRDDVVAKGDILAIRNGGEVRDIAIEFNQSARKEYTDCVQRMASEEKDAADKSCSLRIVGDSYRALEDLARQRRWPMKETLLQAVVFLKWYHDDVIAKGKTLGVSRPTWYGGKFHEVKM